jgi:hypothetical protein
MFLSNGSDVGHRSETLLLADRRALFQNKQDLDSMDSSKLGLLLRRRLYEMLLRMQLVWHRAHRVLTNDCRIKLSGYYMGQSSTYLSRSVINVAFSQIVLIYLTRSSIASGSAIQSSLSRIEPQTIISTLKKTISDFIVTYFKYKCDSVSFYLF